MIHQCRKCRSEHPHPYQGPVPHIVSWDETAPVADRTDDHLRWVKPEPIKAPKTFRENLRDAVDCKAGTPWGDVTNAFHWVVIVCAVAYFIGWIVEAVRTGAWPR